MWLKRFCLFDDVLVAGGAQLDLGRGLQLLRRPSARGCCGRSTQPTLRWSCWLPAQRACVPRSWHVVHVLARRRAPSCFEVEDLRLVAAALDVRLARSVAALAALVAAGVFGLKARACAPALGRALVLVTAQARVLAGVVGLRWPPAALAAAGFCVAADAVPAMASQAATRPASATPRMRVLQRECMACSLSRIPTEPGQRTESARPAASRMPSSTKDELLNDFLNTDSAIVRRPNRGKCRRTGRRSVDHGLSSCRKTGITRRDAEIQRVGFSDSGEVGLLDRVAEAAVLGDHLAVLRLLWLSSWQRKQPGNVHVPDVVRVASPT